MISFVDKRQEMVTPQHKGRDITDPRVIQAMAAIPREHFVPNSQHDQAYHDGPLPIGHGQSISQPYVVAKMCQLLDLTGEETVLDVGTGSGYQAAVLSQLVEQVISIERLCFLAVDAKKRLTRLGYHNITVIIGDGSQAYPENAAYDAIISAAAAKAIPESWSTQLVEKGRIVTPVGKGLDQHLKRYIKVRDELEAEDFGLVAFVPLVQG